MARRFLRNPKDKYDFILGFRQRHWPIKRKSGSSVSRTRDTVLHDDDS